MIISVRRPRRRWVGATVTLVRAEARTFAGPGTVSSVEKERRVPTICPASKAGKVRSGSISGRAYSAKPSAIGWKTAPQAR